MNVKPAITHDVTKLPHPYRGNWMNSDLHTTLSSLPSELRPGVFGPWVAGGSVRRALLGREGDAPAGADIDFFFNSARQFEAWKLGMMEFSNHTAASITVKDHLIEFATLGREFQAITGRYFQNAIALLEDFDFTMCQFVYAAGRVYLGHMALTDAENGNLVFANMRAPVASIRRLAKYKAEGFFVSDDELRRLLRSVVSSPDTIDSELVADYVVEAGGDKLPAVDLPEALPLGTYDKLLGCL